MAKKFTRKRPRTSRRKGGKWTTANKSKLGKPSRGLTKSRYMYAPRVAISIDNIAAIAGADGPRWVNNGPTITGALHRGVFKLSDLPNHATYQALYSSYRINAAKVEFVFTGNINTPTVAASIAYQMNMYSFFDPSGNFAGAIPTEAECLQMQSCRRQLAINLKKHKAYSKLRQANEILQGPTSLGSPTNYTQMKPRWISTGSPNTTHYGVNTMFFNAGPRAQPLAGQAVQVITTYYLEFKGLK